MRNRTRIAVIALVAFLGLGATGLAWAYFSQTTSAQADGATGNMSALVQGATTYEFPSSTDGKLWPGHSGNVIIPLENKNGVPVLVKTITGTAVGGSCASNISQSTSTWALYAPGVGAPVADQNSASNAIIPAGATYTLVITNGVTMNTTATCQNVNFSSTWSILAENR